MPVLKKPTDRMNALLKRSGALDYEVARAAQHELAKALTLPLKQGVLKGDIVSDVFSAYKFDPGVTVEFPLDFLAPGTERNFIAYTVPSIGRIPERHVQGDYVGLNTYEIAASIDFALKYAREARWDIVGRALQVLEGSFVRKMNLDGWHTLLAAGVGRNLLVVDDAAAAGLLSKRLVELGKTVMRRYGGGNSTSVNRGKLSRLYVSPEAMGDIRSWDLDDVDDVTRREIFLSPDQGLTRIFGVELRDLDELGVGQEFQDYFLNTLGGAFTNSKVELAVGLDLSKDDAFVMPVRQEIEVYEDPTFHRQRRAGFYGWGEYGFGCLDNRRTLLLAI